MIFKNNVKVKYLTVKNWAGKIIKHFIISLTTAVKRLAANHWVCLIFPTKCAFWDMMRTVVVPIWFPQEKKKRKEKKIQQLESQKIRRKKKKEQNYYFFV